MCGIAGVLSTNEVIVNGEVIKKMTSSLAHRGPDGEATISLYGCAFGHARLSIIDLTTGDQPMCDPSRRWWIVFNGEIYNYRELRKEMVARGMEFRTQSDTEVVLQGYILFGEDIVDKLNGQFAFSIWDNQERSLFAARDRFGEKPFYWATSISGDFLFASEIKGLLASGLIEPHLDTVSVDLFLALYYIPPARTIYTNIFSLLPGHIMTWREGKIQSRAFWMPKYSENSLISEDDAIGELRMLIRNAVKRQMVADVTIGAFLSGGLDSSTVVALMSEFSDHPVKTFSVGFGDLINELPFAKEVATLYKTDHHEIQMNIPVADTLQKMGVVYDEPFADSSNIPTYLVSQFASRYVKVCLSGDGGDEIFGGYTWYKILLQKAGLAPAEKVSLLRKVVRAGRALARGKNPYPPFQGWWEERIKIASLLDWNRRSLWKNNTMDGTLEFLYSRYRPSESIKEMDRATEFDLQCYLPGDILVKVDRAAMANGLESRAPFLDTELTRFILDLPWRLRFREPRKLKYLLRKTSQQLWPSSLLNRDKQGFNAPTQAWVDREDMKELARRVLRSDGPLNHLLKGLNKSLYDYLQPQQQWTLLSLGVWLENHTDSLSTI